MERVIRCLYYLRIAVVSFTFSIFLSSLVREWPYPSSPFFELRVCTVYGKPRGPSVSVGQLFSIRFRRARSALSLNTPTDLRNGRFPEQTTRRWTCERRGGRITRGGGTEIVCARKRCQEREREKSSLDPGVSRKARESTVARARARTKEHAHIRLP